MAQTALPSADEAFGPKPRARLANASDFVDAFRRPPSRFWIGTVLESGGARSVYTFSFGLQLDIPLLIDHSIRYTPIVPVP